MKRMTRVVGTLLSLGISIAACSSVATERMGVMSAQPGGDCKKSGERFRVVSECCSGRSRPTFDGDADARCG